MKKHNFEKKLIEVGTTWGVPWLVFGNFNAIRCEDERSSGNSVKKVMRDFNRVVDDFRLLEFNITGPYLTYSSSPSPSVSS